MEAFQEVRWSDLLNLILDFYRSSLDILDLRMKKIFDLISDLRDLLNNDRFRSHLYDGLNDLLRKNDWFVLPRWQDLFRVAEGGSRSF